MPEELRLDVDGSVSLGFVTDLYALLRAIDETMPKDAVLYLEGTSVASDIREFLGSHPAPAIRPVAPSTVFPAPAVFHLPLEGANLAELRGIAERHAEPEIGDHLAVYRDDGLLLFAPDAGSGEVFVSRSLPDETLEHLRRSLAQAD